VIWVGAPHDMPVLVIKLPFVFIFVALYSYTVCCLLVELPYAMITMSRTNHNYNTLLYIYYKDRINIVYLEIIRTFYHFGVLASQSSNQSTGVLKVYSGQKLAKTIFAV